MLFANFSLNSQLNCCVFRPPNPFCIKYTRLKTNITFFPSISDNKATNRSTQLNTRVDEWSLRAFASMLSTAIFLRARAEIKNLLCELARNAKIWGARASEHLFKFLRANRAKVKFCEQLKILMDHSSPLILYQAYNFITFYFRTALTIREF